MSGRVIFHIRLFKGRRLFCCKQWWELFALDRLGPYEPKRAFLDWVLAKVESGCQRHPVLLRHSLIVISLAWRKCAGAAGSAVVAWKKKSFAPTISMEQSSRLPWVLFSHISDQKRLYQETLQSMPLWNPSERFRILHICYKKTSSLVDFTQSGTGTQCMGFEYMSETSQYGFRSQFCALVMAVFAILKSGRSI